MRAIPVALLAALIAWLIAHLALDHYLLAQGKIDLGRVQRGDSRIAFEFDQARDLISGGAEAVGGIRVEQGVLRGELTEGRANLRLNLRGLQLDAGRFSRLRARIEVDAPAALALIFDESGRLEQLARQIELHPGWNELDLDLAATAWTPNRGGEPQRWGGASARVAEFRLYLAGPAGLRFGLDYLRFQSARPADASPAVQWIDASTARARLREGAPLGAAADAPLGVLLDVYGDTPERALVLRDQVRAIDAEALFWPAWRGAPKLALSGPAGTPIDWSPDWIGVALYALLALLIRWRTRDLTPASARVDLIVGYAPLLAMSLGLGLAEQPPPATMAWLAAALAFQISGLRVDGSHFLGGAGSWTSTLRVSGLAALALAAIALTQSHWLPPGAQRVALYVPFVALQQLVLLGFLWPRAQMLLPRQARALAAALFALAHAPNFALMLLSLLAAWWWLGLFQRHRAWLPILVSHYLLGLLAITCLPPDFLYSAELGLRYFQVQ